MKTVAYPVTWYHLIWTTRDQAPVLSPEWLPALCADLRRASMAAGLYLDLASGAADHLHALVQLTPDLTPAEAAGFVKSVSARWLEDHTGIGTPWQHRYASAVVNPDQLAVTRRHILRQASFHAIYTLGHELQTLRMPALDAACMPLGQVVPLR